MFSKYFLVTFYLSRLIYSRDISQAQARRFLSKRSALCPLTSAVDQECGNDDRNPPCSLRDVQNILKNTCPNESISSYYFKLLGDNAPGFRHPCKHGDSSKANFGESFCVVENTWKTSLRMITFSSRSCKCHCKPGFFGKRCEKDVSNPKSSGSYLINGDKNEVDEVKLAGDRRMIDRLFAVKQGKGPDRGFLKDELDESSEQEMVNLQDEMAEELAEEVEEDLVDLIGGDDDDDDEGEDGENSFFGL